jgi:hypothetical protein
MLTYGHYKNVSASQNIPYRLLLPLLLSIQKTFTLPNHLTNPFIYTR